MLEIIAGSAMAFWAVAAFAAPIVAVCLMGPSDARGGGSEGRGTGEQADV